jgi:hypothetical protein
MRQFYQLIASQPVLLQIIIIAILLGIGLFAKAEYSKKNPDNNWRIGWSITAGICFGLAIAHVLGLSMPFIMPHILESRPFD